MSRRKRAPRRAILRDPLFRSILLAKFINAIMRSGKKSLAEKIVYDALANVVKRLNASGKVAQLLNEESSDETSDGTSASKQSIMDDIRSDEAARKLALAAFKKALDNVTPAVEVRSRRVGGSTYQVPVEIRGARRVALAMRWLAKYANQRNEKTMVLRLANEIMDALENRGGTVRKREDVHRMAEANQAFAHYRW